MSILRNWRRKKILSQPFPDEWLVILSNNVWQYRSLTASQQLRVRNCVQVMSDEKSWEGVQGFEMEDEVVVTIAGTASLLTLGLSRPFYFDRVLSIIVYPDAIQNVPIRRGYIVDESESYWSGLASQNGPLVFSWPDVFAGSSYRGYGGNVVIHEFAHHIDGLDGEMAGMPSIESDDLQQRWERVFPRELRRLRDAIDRGMRPHLNPYAANNAAEFFAVTTEIFFDSPSVLHTEVPEVFEILNSFFQVDPMQFRQL